MQPAAVPSNPEHERQDQSQALTDLVGQAQRGDQRAFEDIYRQHLGLVFGLCLRMCADRLEAEVLTQDTFVRAWTKLNSYSGKGSLAGWLRRLAVNVVYDKKRADQRRARLIEPFPTLDRDENEDGSLGGRRVAGTSATTLDPARIPIAAIDLERAIVKLPRGARNIFVLHDVEGFPYQEIADMTGVALGTVKAQLHRARKLLRVMLT